MNDLAEIFERERPRLVAIAYRMLGTPDDADDVVQDAWLRFQNHARAVEVGADTAEIERPAAWLTTVVSRLAIDRLRSARSRRETYVGPWLADPLFDTPDTAPTPDDASILAESLSLGFLAVMERLSPAERAAFLLHDVFALPFGEVAEALEKSESATRQLAKRARDHIAAERPRFAPDPSDVEELSMRVLGAAFSGEIDQLQRFLATDVVHVSDGGPNHRAARKPVIGPERVARFFVNLAKRDEPGLEHHPVHANGQSAIYTTQFGEPFMLNTITFVDRLVTASFTVRNPEKLAAFHRQWIATQESAS